MIAINIQIVQQRQSGIQALARFESESIFNLRTRSDENFIIVFTKCRKLFTINFCIEMKGNIIIFLHGRKYLVQKSFGHAICGNTRINSPA